MTYDLSEKDFQCPKMFQTEQYASMEWTFGAEFQWVVLLCFIFLSLQHPVSIG